MVILLSIVLNEEVGKEIMHITTELSKEYELSSEKIGLILQFEYGYHLKVDKVETENAVNVQMLERVAKELLDYSLIYGYGKCSSMNLSADLGMNVPKYEFMCDYVIFSKKPIIKGKEKTLLERLFDLKPKINDSLMICSTPGDMYYFYIGKPGELNEYGISNVSGLNKLCGCKDRGCSLLNYHNIKDIHRIDKASFYGRIEDALSEKIPQYPEISETIKKDILPITQNAMEEIIHQIFNDAPMTKKTSEALGYFG